MTTAMTKRRVTAAWWIAVAVALAALGLEVAYRLLAEDATLSLGDFLWTIVPIPFAALGALIVSRQPGNRIGLILLVIGAGMTLSNLGDAVFFFIDEPPTTMSPQLFAALWYNNVAWATFFFPMFMLLYVFPTGSLLSRRWMWAPRLALVLFGFLVVSSLVSEEIGPTSEAWFVENPIGFVGADVFAPVLLIFLVGVLVLLAGGAVAMVMRYRRAPGVEREQIKWVLFGFFVFATAWVIAFLLESWGSGVVGLLLVLGISVIPTVITIAVLKYHLYDIDVVISRTVTYGVLAAFIGVVYVGIVVGLGELVGGGEGANLGLAVVATAVVAIGFQPVRVRVERWANRLVYGKRATPYEVLASFSHRATDESDEDVLARIPRLIVDGTGAVGAVAWVRSGGGFRSASAWPEVGEVRRLEGSVFDDGEADVSLPVFHGGELLGGISLVAARGGSITPPELELVENLANGLGLTLRNAQLTAALRRQVKDLQRSRDRIVSAGDAARRSLEHDLDSGPQQQLVAVKVKLGPIRKLAEEAGATRTAGLLADIESQAGDAIQAVRDFAAGVYPPLLGAEGLTVALAQETRRAAVPVVLESDDVGRYPA